MKRWSIKPLGELASLEYSKALKAEERSLNGEFPVFGSSNGIVGAFDRALLSEPTIVVGRKGAIDEAHLTENGCWPIDTAFYAVLCERNTISLRLLLLWFRRVDLKSLAITSTIPGLNLNALDSQPVPVPPLAEPERIVRLLDEADELRKLRAQADRCPHPRILSQNVRRLKVFVAKFSSRKTCSRLPIRHIEQVHRRGKIYAPNSKRRGASGQLG